MRLISVLLLWCALLGTAYAAPQRFDHLSAELVAEQREVAPGSTVTVALRLLHDEGWHTYWVNPGDAGIETRFRWTLPEGVSAGPVQWPVPKHFDIGGVHNLGYKDETWLLVDLAVADSVAAGQTLPVGLEASWLVCEEACIPGKGNFSIQLSMDLAVASQSSADTMLRPAFAKARESLPRTAPADWQASFALGEKDVGILLQGPLEALTGAKYVELFVATTGVVAYAPPAIGVTAERIGTRVAKNDYYSADPERIELLWVGNEADGSRVGYRIEANRVAQLAAVIPTPANLPDGPTVAAGGSGPAAPPLGLGWALLFALAGGLILNLMPCVFPVLSLKALSLAESGANDHHARSHSLWYTAGVLVSFAALGLAVILLREAGQALGWGFQLQSPWFVAALVYLFVVLGLSLSGAISIGNRLTGFGQSMTEGEGARSAFFTGVLACVVASPCTAPFMGGALGYAFTLPTAQALLIFLALGLGLALPFLLIGFVPGLARRLPRPGRWMETLKQALAFPLYLSAVWLLWVLGQQVGIDGAALALVGVIVLIFALWWLERVAALGRQPLLRGPRGPEPREVLLSVDAPLPVGGAAHGACAQLHDRRRDQPLPADAGQERVAADGLGCLRVAGGERGDQEQGGAGRVDDVKHRLHEAAAAGAGLRLRLVARVRDLQARVLRARAEAVSGDVRARAGVSEGFDRQLGSGRADRAGERAGGGRQGLAFGRDDRAAGDSAVVLQDHPLCR